ncbi:MAG: GTPase HflX [Cetobacterium sp.]
MIRGNIEGIRDSILSELERIHDCNLEKGRFVSEEVLGIMTEVTIRINREITVAIDRRGRVIDVSIGDSSSAELPILDISSRKLSGVRIIHTHPNGYPNLSMIDISALLKLKLDAIAAVGVTEEGINGVNIGLCKIEGDKLEYREIENLTVEEACDFEFLDIVQNIEKELRRIDVTEDESEAAILVGVDNQESLEELSELARACDVAVVGELLQKRNKPDNVFYIGSGKVRDLAVMRQIKKANLIIFDEELSGVQIKNLEAVTGCKVIDRTILILEIFARRARTREAKIQVELAQLKYRSGRLLGLGSIMSRTGGGIGTKGPGEKKLEIDRRRIKDEIFELRQELEKIKKNRALQREKRESSGIPKVALVGYTNVGKSTLRNLLVDLYPGDNTSKKEAVFAENMLFATLDATTRSITLPDKRIAALTDTVGFVRKLPHDLVEAFKSTLEEVVFSDLLVHVVDVSSETVIEQIKAVETVLKELSADDKATILALNKCDKATEEQIAMVKEACKNYTILEISAKDNMNIDTLMEMTVEMLPRTMKRVEYLIPYSESSINAYLHRNGIIENEEYEGEGTKIVATVSDEVYNKTKQFIVTEF